MIADARRGRTPRRSPRSGYSSPTGLRSPAVEISTRDAARLQPHARPARAARRRTAGSGRLPKIFAQIRVREYVAPRRSRRARRARRRSAARPRRPSSRPTRPATCRPPSRRASAPSRAGSPRDTASSSAEPRLPLPDVVDLEPELDGQPRTLGLEHGVAVDVEVVDAPLGQVRNVPDLGGLPEVVDVLGEADLVDAARQRRLDERRARRRGRWRDVASRRHGR